jgi:hypothetical protein
MIRTAERAAAALGAAGVHREGREETMDPLMILAIAGWIGFLTLLVWVMEQPPAMTRVQPAPRSTHRAHHARRTVQVNRQWSQMVPAGASQQPGRRAVERGAAVWGAGPWRAA